MNTELIDYYKNLLIMQYRDKPKALAHTGVVLDAGMIYDIAIAVRDGFGINDARGKQLDVLGRILGVSRTITGTTFTRAYYGYALYGDTTPFIFNPMLLYGAEPPDVQFRDYRESSQSLYDLTDEEYRIILKLAIVRNTSNASVKTIDEILNVLFGAECYFIDRMNMTVVSYMVGAKWSRIFGIAKSSGLLPNPAGVGTILVVVPDINNIFAYSLYGGAKPDFAVGYGDYFGKWEKTGNELTITTYGYVSAAGLTDSLIVIVNGDNKLRSYHFNGTDWTQVGNEKSVGGGNHYVSKLSENSVVSAGLVLQKYNFDGADFTEDGNGLTLNEYYVSVAGMTESRIALASNANQTLRAYDFDGTDWVQVGNALPISCGIGSMTRLSDTRIALFEMSSNKLRAYDFDGTDWTLAGNEFPLVYLSRGTITALSPSRVAFVAASEYILKEYSFDGTDWTETTATIPVGNHYRFGLAGMSSSRIASIGNEQDRLQTYDLTKDTIGCMASYS